MMADSAAPTDDYSANLAESEVAAENWGRYEYVRDRGHIDYCRRARRLEDMYLGGGTQWEAADKKIVEEIQGRMALEFNEIMPAVNAAVGYQIANRMDIAFEPRSGAANEEIATVLSKVAMQIADSTHLHWKETEVFGDGLIQRRGFYDVRIDFDDSMRGVVAIDVLDPMDVLPDPDAKTYETNGWSDVITTRWLTLDQIESRYGSKARAAAEQRMGAIAISEDDFGDRDEMRSKIGNTQAGAIYDAIKRDRNLVRLRIIDRQKYVYRLCQVVVSPDTGDVRLVEDLPPDHIKTIVAAGGILTRRLTKRIRWTVTTWESVLHDDWSPYPTFTVIPFFAYFRRGRNRGMVDNAMGPQNALNKAVSQYIHIINTTANSGWTVEENSLTNMTTDDLADNGAKTGLVLEHKKGAKPEKIQPNTIPSGLDHMIDRLTTTLKENTVPDAARGIDDGGAESGVSRNSKQFAAQQQLAIPLDNLKRTRHMLAEAILWMVQAFYDDERIFRIARQDSATGQSTHDSLKVNYADPVTGEILNDLTLGEYGVVVSESPMTVTFEDGQFNQALNMRKEGVAIPDYALIRASNLADKNELIQRMTNQQQKQPDPLVLAKTSLATAQAALIAAQTEKTKADKVSDSVQAQFAAIQTAQTIAQVPATAPLADALLKSAGYVDMDAAPIIPNAPPGLPTVPMPQNTNPLHPAHADVGAHAGIEGGQP